MKKIICLILCLELLFIVTGCSYSVPTPMQYPDYTFEAEPESSELRATAVRAMHDLLSIQWYTKKEINYRKSGPLSFKDFCLEPKTTYGGVLYSGAYSGLFQFLEYYSSEDGCLEFNGTDEELKVTIGSSCADALLWSWSAVCNSIEGGFYPALMVPQNGYQIVGDYTFRQVISNYNELPTYAIINDHPKEVIMDAYAKTLPADALVSTPDNHAMMVIEEPVVVYKKDGSIDSENSYLIIQDQRGGDNTSTIEVVDGIEIPYNGRLRAKYTFEKLYEKDYIPLTTAEFAGKKTYDKATVTATDTNCKSLDALAEVSVESNYPLAIINIISINSKGKESVMARKTIGGASMYGVPKSYKLSDIENFSNLSPAKGEIIKIEVVVSTGERFYPIEFTV